MTTKYEYEKYICNKETLDYTIKKYGVCYYTKCIR